MSEDSGAYTMIIRIWTSNATPSQYDPSGLLLSHTDQFSPVFVFFLFRFPGTDLGAESAVQRVGMECEWVGAHFVLVNFHIFTLYARV